jgi:hypothetical protein
MSNDIMIMHYTDEGMFSTESYDYIVEMPHAATTKDILSIIGLMKNFISFDDLSSIIPKDQQENLSLIYKK